MTRKRPWERRTGGSTVSAQNAPAVFSRFALAGALPGASASVRGGCSVPHPGQALDCRLSAITVQPDSPGSTLTTFKLGAGDQEVDVFIPFLRQTSFGCHLLRAPSGAQPTTQAPRVNQTPPKRLPTRCIPSHRAGAIITERSFSACRQATPGVVYSCQATGFT